MFCRHCGSQIEGQGVVCVKCGVPTGKGVNYCPNCGEKAFPGAVVCNFCGMVLEPAPREFKAGKGLSIAAIVCGIISVLLGCWVSWPAFFLGIAGVVLGGVALAQKKGNKVVAIAGFVCAVIGLVILIITMAVVGAVITRILGV